MMLRVRTFLAAFLTFLACNQAIGAGGTAKLEIDRVDLTGIKAFTPDVAEKTLEIGPGDLLDRAKVLRTEKNLQNLYHFHGYEEVSIQARLVRRSAPGPGAETVLEFMVAEGSPTRVATVKMVRMGESVGGKTGFWDLHQRKLLAIVDRIVGDIFDQEKVSELKRALHEYMASEGLIGTQIEVNVSALKKAAQREVNIEFRINPGEKVSFGFRGNTIFTKGYLSGLVDEQRVLGLGKDYKGVIKARLEDEYRNFGFSQVKIQSLSIEDLKAGEQRVTYLIDEGPQVRIDSVEFDGNSVFPSNELRERFFHKASSLVKNRIYVERDVQKAAELLIQSLKENGYLGARLITVSSQAVSRSLTRKDESLLRLTLYLYEGEQTLVHGVKITGSTVLNEIEIRKLLKVEEGVPLNLFALGEGLETLKRIYLDKGYLSFRIENEGTDTLVQYSQENRVADIFIEIDEGYQYRVSRLLIEGLQRTKEKIVQQELVLKEGDVLGESKLIQSERQIRKLGIFSTVSFQVENDSTRPGYKIVRISLSEADRGVLTVGPGYRNDLGVRLFGQLAYSNLWGENHTLLLNANVNRRLGETGIYQYRFVEAQGLVAYVWPSFWLPDMTFRPALAVGKTQYINFSAFNITGSASFEKPLFVKPNLLGNLGYSFEHITQTDAQLSIDNQQLVIGTVTPKISLDLRDNSLAPSSGFFGTSWLDFAGPLLGSQTNPAISYYRAQARTDFYIPLGREIIWFQSFRGGYEKSLVPSVKDAIPLIKQFALGGVGSLRGYVEQELNKTYHGGDRTVKSSLSYLNSRTQVDFPMAGALKMGLFLDVGALYIDDAIMEGYKYGLGFGLHYVTPVGAVNLDWGFKLNPTPSDEPYVVHISVGVI